MLISLLTVLTSCWKTEEERRLEQAGKVMEQQNTLQNEAMALAQRNANWELSDEQYEKEMAKLNEGFEELSDKVDGSIEKMSEDDIPSWAKKLGLRKISWLDFNQGESEIIKVDSVAWFDGVNMSYLTSDYDKAIEEAESLAKDLDLKEADMSPRKSIESTKKMLWSMWMTEEQKKEMEVDMLKDMWGAMFLNCILWTTCTKEETYAKMLTVEENDWKWEIAISIVNNEQWLKQMDKHNKFVK